MKTFTITVSDSGEVVLSHGVTATACKYKDTEHAGLNLGCFLNAEDKQIPKFFKIHDATIGTTYMDLNVSYADRNGMRYGSLPTEDGTTDSDTALVHLFPSSVVSSAKFLQSNYLRDAKIILEGKWYTEPGPDGRINRKIFSCPAVLFAQKGEQYNFQYMQDGTMYVTCIEFDGEEIKVISTSVKEPYVPKQKFGSLKQAMEDARNRPRGERTRSPRRNRDYSEAIARATR